MQKTQRVESMSFHDAMQAWKTFRYYRNLGIKESDEHFLTMLDRDSIIEKTLELYERGNIEIV